MYELQEGILDLLRVTIDHPLDVPETGMLDYIVVLREANVNEAFIFDVAKGAIRFDDTMWTLLTHIKRAPEADSRPHRRLRAAHGTELAAQGSSETCFDNAVNIRDVSRVCLADWTSSNRVSGRQADGWVWRVIYFATCGRRLGCILRG
jgi:hypothetical protein